MLILLTMLCLWLGLQANEARQQRKAIETVTRLSGTVHYDFQRSQDSMGNDVIDPSLEPPGPQWARKLLGPEFFQQVATVSLRDTRATDEDIQVLRDLSSLEGLDLSNTEITDRGLAVVEDLPQLKWLSLIDTNITDAGLVHLQGLTDLEGLSLWKTDVTDDGLRHIAHLTTLRSLVLDETRITDEGLVHLRGLTNLEEWLGLTHTKITDAGVEHLKGFNKLKHLNLIGTEVSRDGLKELRHALPRTDISPY